MDTYAQGFMDKCAELGVDPEQLVKVSGLADMMAVERQDFKRDLGTAGKGALKGQGMLSALLASGNRPSEGSASHAYNTWLKKELKRTGKDLKRGLTSGAGLYGGGILNSRDEGVV